jgi:hypothetical protein
MSTNAAVGAVLLLLACVPVACGQPVRTTEVRPAPTGSLAGSPIPSLDRAPGLPATPEPSASLTDAEAIGQIEDQILARRVASDTLRIRILEDPRVASIRYASAYSVDSNVFHAETVLIALVVARIVGAVDPPVTDGLRLAVIPAGGGDIGLRVTVIEGSNLAAWVAGSISDQEFIDEWTVAAVTRE